MLVATARTSGMVDIEKTHGLIEVTLLAVDERIRNGERTNLFGLFVKYKYWIEGMVKWAWFIVQRWCRLKWDGPFVNGRFGQIYVGDLSMRKIAVSLSIYHYKYFVLII